MWLRLAHAYAVAGVVAGRVADRGPAEPGSTADPPSAGRADHRRCRDDPPDAAECFGGRGGGGGCTGGTGGRGTPFGLCRRAKETPPFFWSFCRPARRGHGFGGRL